jgi:release factor glutamine methyltransferase
MTIAEALKKYKDIEADLLLAHALKQPKEFLYLNPKLKLNPKQLLSFKSIAEKRRNGVPAAYLLGYKHFYGLKFKVNRNVLIPRPESEWLVDRTLKIASKSKKKLRLLEVGTGSGCLAVSIAKGLDPKKSEIVATDISDKALEVAKYNSKLHKTKVKFIYSDLLNHVSGKFDIVIANLPYVPVSDYLKLHKNLAYEPFLALTDGTDSFELIKEFITEVKKHLKPKATMLLETDPKSIKILKDHIKEVLKKKVSVVKDIHGLNRFLLVR